VGAVPFRTVSDPTAVRLNAEHTLTVTEAELVLLEDARSRGEPCEPLDWSPEGHHPAGRERVTLAAGVQELPVAARCWQIYFAARYMLDA
jgi:hypothetical protein